MTITPSTPNMPNMPSTRKRRPMPLQPLDKEHQPKLDPKNECPLVKRKSSKSTPTCKTVARASSSLPFLLCRTYTVNSKTLHTLPRSCHLHLLHHYQADTTFLPSTIISPALLRHRLGMPELRLEIINKATMARLQDTGTRMARIWLWVRAGTCTSNRMDEIDE